MKLFIIGVLIAISITALVFVSLPSGVISNSPDSTPIQSKENDSFQKSISLGTIDNEPSKIFERFDSFSDYLSSNIGDGKYGVKIIVEQNIESLVTKIKNQELDLYVDSPLITCQISEQTNMMPFLLRWKEGVSSYHTVFFTTSDSSISEINQEILGKTIALETPESTTSYILPKQYLSQKGISLSENDGVKIVISGSDLTTADWVISGKVDLGAMSNLDFENLPDSFTKNLKIVERTFDIPRHILSYRSNMESDLVLDITQVLLNMDKNEEGLKILSEFKNTKKFTELPNKDRFCDELNKKLSRDG